MFLFTAAFICSYGRLAITAVLQIICLNRGLKVYDSTLVVPVFYGVYTAMGFLDSLVSYNIFYMYKHSDRAILSDIQRPSGRIRIMDAVPHLHLYHCLNLRRRFAHAQKA